MNKTIKTIITVCLAAPVLTGCLDETFPTSGMTQEQVDESTSSLEFLTTALPSQMMAVGNDYSSIGYPGIMLSLDVASGNLPIASTAYDYIQWYANDTYLGETGQTIYDWWAMYSNLIHCANIIVNKAPMSSEATADELGYLGNALVYRAMAYLDMVRLYEYKHTGYADLDGQAEAAGIYKLTVPLITENTTEQEARNNPRQPFYVIYRYILTDLNRAEVYLQGYNRPGYNMADQSVVFGLKARLWLEIGSRLTLYPEDQKTIQEHENDEALSGYARLGIKSPDDCFANAANYARMAINEGATPLTKSEWHDAKTGFNTANHAWMWAVQIGSDDIASTAWSYNSFVAYMCPEALFGVANSMYGAQRMIDAYLYSTIENGDWRKRTWIAPDDAGSLSSKSKYSTQMNDNEWQAAPAYTGLKFRAAEGDLTNYLVGVAVDIPLMRVEEMYLIEAEALAHTGTVFDGIAALEDFLNTYRYDDGSYKCTVATLEKFNDEILRQRRIEFWGEGIVGYDYKRLEKMVRKKYTDSNHPSAYQANSINGYVPARMNACFPQSETLYNNAIVNNPNPSGYH